MNDSIEKRIAAIATELEKRRLIQSEPVDPLSASLYELGRELAGLDKKGKAELLQSLNKDGLNLSQDAFEQFVTEYRMEARP